MCPRPLKRSRIDEAVGPLGSGLAWVIAVGPSALRSSRREAPGISACPKLNATGRTACYV